MQSIDPPSFSSEGGGIYNSVNMLCVVSLLRSTPSWSGARTTRTTFGSLPSKFKRRLGRSAKLWLVGWWRLFQVEDSDARCAPTIPPALTPDEAEFAIRLTCFVSFLCPDGRSPHPHRAALHERFKLNEAEGIDMVSFNFKSTDVWSAIFRPGWGDHGSIYFQFRVVEPSSGAPLSQ